MVVSVVSVGTLSALFVVRRAAPDAARGRRRSAGSGPLTVPAIAAAFLVGLVRRRLDGRRRAHAASPSRSAGGSTGRSCARRSPRRSTTRRSTCWFPTACRGRWRDTDGRLTSRSEIVARGRALTPISDDDAPVLALVHDPALRDDEELLDVGRSLVLTTVRARAARGRARRRRCASSRTSRQRIARAADLERSRIERDLHDGAQQRLIALRIKLSMAEELCARDPRGRRRGRARARRRDRAARSRSCARSHTASIRRCSPTAASTMRCAALPRSPLPVHLLVRGVRRYSAGGRDRGLLHVPRGDPERDQARRRRQRRLGLAAPATTTCDFEVRDDGPGFVPPDGDGNGGLATCATASKRSAGA